MTDDAVPPQQGDEHELFERYAARLHRVTRRSINTTPEIIDDACAFAWMKLVEAQPRRETVFPWLKAVARNEALYLDRLARHTIALGNGSDDDVTAPEPAGVRRRPEAVQGLLELRERLAELPERQRELVFLNAAGWRYQDLAERFGISETRVNQLLSTASAKMRDMDVRDHAITSPRAQRLRSLEDSPPQYLVAAIGHLPKPSRRIGNEGLRRDWRRLAMSIEDFRAENGITSPIAALGRAVTAPDYRTLSRRIQSFRQERGLGRGLER